MRGSGGRPAAARRASMGSREPPRPSSLSATRPASGRRRWAGVAGVGSRRVGPLGAHAEPEPPSRPLALRDPRQALAPDRERLRQVAREQARRRRSARARPRRRGRGGRRPAARRRTARGPGRAARRSSPPARRRCRRSPSPGSRTAPPPPSRPGAAMTVFAPLSTTTWRHSAAAAIAARDARRVVGREVAVLRPASWPLPARSRANSPACGVRTHGRVTRSTTRRRRPACAAPRRRARAGGRRPPRTR